MTVSQSTGVISVSGFGLMPELLTMTIDAIECAFDLIYYPYNIILVRYTCLNSESVSVYPLDISDDILGEFTSRAIN